MAGTGSDPSRFWALTAVLLTSGCATYRTPSISSAIAEAQRKTCDEFARGEVRRLGESVPAAFAKGIVIGFALDVVRARDAAHVAYGPARHELPDVPESGGDARNHRLSPELPNPAQWSIANISPALNIFPWTPLGGSQLARDAVRTNEDVYEQAIQRCLAPTLLAQEFGLFDARVATSLELLANCYMWQHKYALAEPLQRQAVAIWGTVLWPNDLRVARALEDHAAVLRHVHRAAEADSLQSRAAGIRAQFNGSGSSPRPAPGHESLELRCTSPLTAAIFVLCHDLRESVAPMDTP
jgi:hypothetical protein